MSAKSPVRVLSLPDPCQVHPIVRWVIATGVLLAAAGLLADASQASSALIAGSAPTSALNALEHPSHTRLIAGQDARLAELSDQEYFSYSGVGAVTCSVNGQRRASTAFLVGSFDLAVTVAHTFDVGGVQATAADCVYTSIDSTGQIRERIPVAYYKSQWLEAGAGGVPAKDLAVLRLTERSTFAYRTLPLGKFSGASAPVTMIGFNADMDTDTFKRKSRGTVYERDGKKRNRALAVADIFTHDMDSRELASGAPVLDERSGVIIGVHTSLVPSALQATAEHTAVSKSFTARNALITMDQWLESTLRTEIASEQPANAQEANAK